MMIKISRILCPTDLSIESDQALRYALALTRAYEAQLTILYCKRQSGSIPFPDAAGSEGVHDDLQGHVEEAIEDWIAEQEVYSHVSWAALVKEGEDVGELIASTAAERQIDLIVMRSRRRPHRAALLGSTAESVCRTAPCPVLVTHSDEREWIDGAGGGIVLKKVLVAYDFSDYSELALKYALSVAQEYQAELHVLHVLPPRSVSDPEIAWPAAGGETAYHRAARRLQKAIPEEAYLWCKVKHAVAEGQPYREVLSYADRHEIDLISLGAHGAGFGMRALFGSNVDRVLRQAPCPVLVARPLKPAIKKSSLEWMTKVAV
jgi:nucleotide-binding universal stress UspA family protein